MKGRKGLIAVAVLCVLTQLGLGASTALGLVLCVGADHTAVELPSDDCCANHGATPDRATIIEESCCSDVPLVSAWRSLSDVRRVDVAAGAAFAGASAALRASLATPFGRLDSASTWSPPPLALRPAILRV
jgi:hypothetical protein